MQKVNKDSSSAGRPPAYVIGHCSETSGCVSPEVDSVSTFRRCVYCQSNGRTGIFGLTNPRNAKTIT